MNLTVNSLPTRTWNRLGMNETALTLEGEFTDHTPLAKAAEGVCWNENAAAAFTTENDLEALTAEASTALAETKAGAVMEAPLVLTYRYAAGEHAVSRLVLHAAEKSTLRVVLVLQSEAEDNVCALQTEILADEDAKVELYTAQLMGDDSICLHSISGVCKDRANVSLTRLELGSGKLYAGAVIDLAGRESSFNTEIGYHAKENQLLDMNYVALHKGERTQSLMEVSGTLEENSRKIFRGTIDFRPGCSGAKGTENENVLLLGEEMVNQTIPLILCAEEDVEGNHGASIGRLDEKVLFYLGSRGISEEKAQQIIAQSRIEAVCEKFPDEETRDVIREYESRRGIIDEPEL